MAEERVQKILARAGYGSRRASEEIISAGRVRINGVIAALGSKADPSRDTITVDNQPIARAQAPVYIAVNKPQGILSEVSPDEPRETVRDLVPLPGHMFIVGRLDLDSEGLILMTNDGELANRLTHPRYGHEKEYRVLVGSRPDEEQFQAWRHGIVLEDGHRTAPADVRLEGISGKNAWLRVILHEGRKRQIREMGKLTGLPVLRIIRVRIGTLTLGELKPGQWRELRPDEVRALRAQAPRQTRAGSNRQPRRAGQPPARGGNSKPLEGGRSYNRPVREQSSSPDARSRRPGDDRRPADGSRGPAIPRKPTGLRRQEERAESAPFSDRSERSQSGPRVKSNPKPSSAGRPQGAGRPFSSNRPKNSARPVRSGVKRVNRKKPS